MTFYDKLFLIMRNLLLDLKIRKELKRFQNFKRNYVFRQKEVKKVGEKYFCDDECVRENDESDFVGETEKFVNVGYKLHGALPKILSNLFPYKFYFKGHILHSVESFFQGIKFKNKKAQKLVFSLSGLDSNNIKAGQDYDWTADERVYFWGKAYKRDSKEYENLVDELYVSLLQNPLFVDALKAVKSRHILHLLGEEDPSKTVFTRLEFELELNCLKDYCLMYK